MYEHEIYIVGYGEVVSGTSANGKPFAFRPVYVTYTTPYVVGETTDTWLAPPDVFTAHKMDEGQVWIMLCDIGKRKNGTYGIRYAVPVRQC